MLQIISHEVKNVEEWLSFNDERVKTFSKFADNIVDFVKWVPKIETNHLNKVIRHQSL